MYSGWKVSAVIPCYKVERHIRNVIASMPEYVDQIIAVNDGSPDSTEEILKSISDPRLVVISHKKNQGLGAAMLSGFKEALRQGADVVVKVDGDGQMDPTQIIALIHPIVLGKCDYSKGNRLSSGKNMKGMPNLRLFGNLVLSFLTKAATGYWKMMDPQNGFIAISGKLLAKIELNKIARNFFFENSMLIEISLQNTKVADVVMSSRYGEEISTLSIKKVILQFPWQLAKGFLRRIFVRNLLLDLSPFVIFLFLGLLLIIPGGFLGLWLWIKALVTHSTIPTPTGTIMLSLVPLICGYILIVQAIVIDIIFSPEILLLEYDEEMISQLLKQNQK